MFNPIFRKLFWKEFWTFLPFWIAVFSLASSLLVTAYSQTVHGIDDQIILGLSIFMTILYACGCSASSFAWELENGTFGRLRSLPVASKQIATAKLTWSIVSSALLLLALFLFGLPFCSGMTMTKGELIKVLIIYLPLILEGIAWGTLFSTFTRQPMLAIIFTGVATFGCTALWAGSVQSLPSGSFSSSVLELLAVRFFVFLIIAGFAAYRATHWFACCRAIESREPLSDLFDSNSATDTRNLSVVTNTRFIALLKHYYRQNRSLFWTVLSTFSFVAIVLIATALMNEKPNFGQEHGAGLLFSWLVIACTIIASNMFSGDQRQDEFRFFAHRGISPRMVWISRLFFTGTLFGVLWTCTFFIACLYWMSDLIHDFGEQATLTYAIDTYFVIGLTLLASGAICSMLFKSRLVAWASTVCIITLCNSCPYYFLGKPISTLIIIPAVGFLLGSYFYSIGWICERKNWRTHLDWITPITLSFIVFIAVTRMIYIPQPITVDTAKQTVTHTENQSNPI